MAKVTWRDLKADDPIFRQGPMLFVPVSRPSTGRSEAGEPGKVVPDAKAATKPVTRLNPKKR